MNRSTGRSGQSRSRCLTSDRCRNNALTSASSFGMFESLERRAMLCAGGVHDPVRHAMLLEAASPDVNVLARAGGANRMWQPLSTLPAAPAGKKSYLTLTSFTPFKIDGTALKARLAEAPTEFTAQARTEPLVLSLPTPDGTMTRFRVQETFVLPQQLGAQYPGIKTYVAQGIDDPRATARLDYTYQGFHAQVLSPAGAWYIDPYFHLSEAAYVSYYKADAVRPATWSEGVPGELHEDHAREAHEEGNVLDGGTDAITGTELRTYRVVIGATGEYTAFQGGTVPLGLSAVTTSINRISGVYENDFAVRMVLVPTQNNFIFTNAATDPYTSPSNASTSNTQNQTYMDGANLGSANYDFGHVYYRGSDNGLAGAIGNVGVTGQKAKGYSSHSSPVNDPFTIDYVAHEMGHQFGGRHNFNNCNGSQGDSSAIAVEVGSGSSIMSYAGICGSTNLQAHSDAMFNSINFDQIAAYTLGGTGYAVAQKTATGNTPPTVEAGANYTIPSRTPFELTAVGFDADNDALTYSWEQRNGGAQLTPGTDNGAGPIFRPWLPTSSPTRTFPRLANLLSNTVPFGEILPQFARSAMSFTVQVRDNRAGGGGSTTDNMFVTVVNVGSTGFAVTSPNTSGLTWNAGTTQTVSWNVATTDVSPINTSNVNIKLSLDGGNTYPVTLAANTPNDGSEDIVVPANLTNLARVRVEAVGNIFFDIANFNLTIASAPSTPAQPVLAAGSDSGVSNSDRITNFDNSSPAKALELTIGNTIAGATVTVYADGVPVGSAVASGTTTTVITDGATALANGVRQLTARQTPPAQPESPDSPSLAVTIDTVAPALGSASAFSYATAPHTLSYAFNENVGPTLTAADWTVQQVPGGGVPIAMSYNGGTNVATINFTAAPGGVLAEGNYRSTLGAAGVTDVAGNAMAANDVLDFFFLLGDANHDGRVNLNDFNILAANFGQSPRDYTQADFDYSGNVNLNDFNILAGRFGAVLAPASVAGRPGSSLPPAGGDDINELRDLLV